MRKVKIYGKKEYIIFESNERYFQVRKKKDFIKIYFDETSNSSSADCHYRWGALYAAFYEAKKVTVAHTNDWLDNISDEEIEEIRNGKEYKELKEYKKEAQSLIEHLCKENNHI